MLATTFRSLDISGQIVGPLHQRLIFLRTINNQWTHYNWQTAQVKTKFINRFLPGQVYEDQRFAWKFSPFKPLNYCITPSLFLCHSYRVCLFSVSTCLLHIHGKTGSHLILKVLAVASSSRHESLMILWLWFSNNYHRDNAAAVVVVPKVLDAFV